MGVMQIRGGRRSHIYQSITKILETGSYNVYQIKEKLEKNKINVSWEAINSALHALESINFVKQETKAGRICYSLNQCNKLNDKTILGLPISAEQESLCCGLANRFKELNPDVSRTFLQKMLIQLINKRKLNIPYGWYLYGPCCVLKLTDDILQNHPSNKDYDSDIKEIISQFKRYENTNELMEDVYRKNPLYLHRLKINKMLSEPIRNKSSLDLLNLELKHLIWSFEENEENSPILNYLMSFYSMFVRLSKLPVEQFEETRVDILACFKSVWELIGTYEMYNTTKRFYPSQNTSCNFQLAYYHLKTITEMDLLNINSLCPKIEISPKMQKLRDSLVKKSR